MRNRTRAFWGCLMAIATLSAAETVIGQTKPPTSRPWAVPRTPDGHPDLEGVWLSRSATPLERPKALEGKSRLTDEELAQLKARAARLFNSTGVSDFASGDAVFLAALDDRAQFTAVTSTHGSEEMIEREFDHHTSLVFDPSDGHIPALTAEGQARRAARVAATRRMEGPEALDNANRCLAWGTPRLGGRYGAGDLGFYQIVQTPGYVVLFMETGHEARIIPLDGRPHTIPAAGQWSGDSRGRWEGDTLVVDTINFSPNSNFMGAGARLHVIERIARTAADTITYQMTLDDPTTWTRPWSAEMPLKRSDEMLYESACHEGNEKIIEGLLAAGRLQ